MGGGGCKSKSLLLVGGGGMDIFWNHMVNHFTVRKNKNLP